MWAFSFAYLDEDILVLYARYKVWEPKDFALQKMGDTYSFILNVSGHLSNICMTWLAMLYQMNKHRQYMAVSHGVPSPESRVT